MDVLREVVFISAVVIMSATANAQTTGSEDDRNPVDLARCLCSKAKNGQSLSCSKRLCTLDSNTLCLSRAKIAVKEALFVHLVPPFKASRCVLSTFRS